MIFGVVGTFASGKDTVAHYLASKGYQHISTANVIRDEMTAQGLPLDRDTMTAFATQTRAEHGNAYFTEKVMAQIKDNAVFADMRHPDEITTLRGYYGGDFLLIAVDAPIEVRYQRAQQRGRIGEGETLADFQAKEERELSGQLGSHYLGKVISLADVTIDNDGDLERLYNKVDAIVARSSGQVTQ